MGQVLVARLLRLLVLRDVIVAVGQAQPALADARNFHAGIVQVGLRPETEKNIHALRLQIGNRLDQVGFVFDSGNTIQTGFEHRDAFGIHGGLIHAGLVEVSNLLHNRSALGVIYGCFFQNSAQDLPDVFRQLIETPPACLVRRDGVVLAPGATSVLIKVGTRIYRLVHGSQIERLAPGRQRRLRRRFLRNYLIWVRSCLLAYRSSLGQRQRNQNWDHE